MFSIYGSSDFDFGNEEDEPKLKVEPVPSIEVVEI